MARTVTLSGQSYTIPEQGDVGWGSLTDLIERLTSDVNNLNSSTLATPTPLRRRVREVTTSPTTLLDTDDVVLVDISGLASINLPDASTIDVGKIITIKDSSGLALTNTISVFGFGGATIDGGAQYDINDSFGDASFVLRDDGNWNRIQSLDADYENGMMPIGTIFAITTHLTGSWTLPASGAVKRGLMLCDGSVIPVGQTLSGSVPDLSDDRFIRGATTSGGSGAATDLSHTHTLAHTHDTDSALGSVDFSHDHSASTGTDTAVFTAGTVATSGGAASFDKTVMNTDQNSHTHAYGLQYGEYNSSPATLFSSRYIGLFDYPSGGGPATTVYGSGTAGTFPTNTNAAATTTSRSAVLRQVGADTSYNTASWTSATVNTTFTQPTLDKTLLNGGAQTAHSHTISSDLSTVDFAHTHTTTSQSTDTTSASLSALSVEPKYFNAIYLIRVS